MAGRKASAPSRKPHPRNGQGQGQGQPAWKRWVLDSTVARSHAPTRSLALRASLVLSYAKTDKAIGKRAEATLEMIWSKTEWLTDDHIRGMWDEHRVRKDVVVAWFAERRRQSRQAKATSNRSKADSAGAEVEMAAVEAEAERTEERVGVDVDIDTVGGNGNGENDNETDNEDEELIEF